MWNKIKTFFSNKTNLSIVLLTLLNLGLTPLAFRGIPEFSAKHLIFILVTELCTEAILVYFIYRTNRKQTPIEKRFLFLSLFLGTLMSFFLQIGQVPDEYAHIVRTYSINGGNLVTNFNSDNKGVTEVPLAVGQVSYHAARDYPNYFNSVLATDNQEYVINDNTDAATYNFILYIPQVIGLKLGEILHLPIGVSMLFARFCNLLVFSLFVYFAIKITPKFKTFFLFFALLPITLQQAASFSVDALTIGVTFLLIAYAFYLIFGKINKLHKKHIVYIYLLSALVMLCKVAYFPLCALFLLVPAQKFGSKKIKWLNAGGAIFIALGLELVWLHLQQTAPAQTTAQVNSLIENPLRYLLMLFGTLFDYKLDHYLESGLGASLGWFSISLPKIYFYSALILIVYYLFQNNEKITVTPAIRSLTWAIFCSITILFMTVIYTQFSGNTLGTGKIEGVQGRYFIPIIPLLPVMLYNNNIRKSTKPISANSILIFVAFFNVCAYCYIFTYNLV